MLLHLIIKTGMDKDSGVDSVFIKERDAIKECNSKVEGLFIAYDVVPEAVTLPEGYDENSEKLEYKPVYILMDEQTRNGQPVIMGLYLDEQMALDNQERIYGLASSDWNTSGKLDKGKIKVMYIQ